MAAVRHAALATFFTLLQTLPAHAADPPLRATVREVVSSYSWGYRAGVKQHLGSYKNGRSLHALARRSGRHGENGLPDYLVWVDEHRGSSRALRRPIGYPQEGINPASHAVFTSNAPAHEQGRIWWVLGGRSSAQPFDLAVSLGLFDPSAYAVVLDDFVRDGHSTTPSLAAVGETGLLAYRWLGSGAPDGEVRLQRYDIAPDIPRLVAERALGRASFTAALGNVTIEQVFSRWDPRHRALAVSWQWYANRARDRSFGSNPFLYTRDLGRTWRLADGSAAALPLEYATTDATVTPYDHLARGQTTGWLPRDLGFSPNGTPWIALPAGATPASRHGWQLRFFRWGGSRWHGFALSRDLQANADAAACGSTRDYLVCAYSEHGSPGALEVRVSADDGRSWSAPQTVHSVGRAPNGASQRIAWVSFAQPADRYLDNAARFFLGYYQSRQGLTGQLYRNNIRWVRLQVGPRADFDGDGRAGDRDADAFMAAYASGAARADFDDDGSVDDRDLAAFESALAADGVYRPDDDGLLSIEAEHCDAAPRGWSSVLARASNTGAIRAVSGPATPEADRDHQCGFPVRFQHSGPHAVWLRLRAFDGAQKHLRVALDDATPVRIAAAADGAWRWKRLRDPLAVPGRGVHVLRIHREAGDVEIDKIVMTPGDLVPAGEGPPESRRE